VPNPKPVRVGVSVGVSVSDDAREEQLHNDTDEQAGYACVCMHVCLLDVLIGVFD